MRLHPRAWTFSVLTHNSWFCNPRLMQDRGVSRHGGFHRSRLHGPHAACSPHGGASGERVLVGRLWCGGLGWGMMYAVRAGCMVFWLHGHRHKGHGSCDTSIFVSTCYLSCTILLLCTKCNLAPPNVIPSCCWLNCNVHLMGSLPMLADRRGET